MTTVSVVIPTYNRRHFLADTIASVLSPDAGDDRLSIEILVVDDGSSDGTVEWLSDTHDRELVRVLTNRGAKGPAGGRNTGIKESTGEFVAFLDSDDVFLPGHLAASVDLLHRFPGVDVVFGRSLHERDGVAVDYMGPNFDRKLALAPKEYEDNRVVLFGDSFFSHLLDYGCWFSLSTVVMRATAARELMNDRLRVSEDYEYWVRLSRSHRFACLLEPQGRARLHDGNTCLEVEDQVIRHAERLLQALQVIRDYSALQADDVSRIERQMAVVLFDWAWRCRRAGAWRQAAGLHWRSLHHGLFVENITALIKLPMTAVRPMRRSGLFG